MNHAPTWHAATWHHAQIGARSEIHRMKGEMYAPPDHMDMVYGYCERFRGDRMTTFHFMRECARRTPPIQVRNLATSRARACLASFNPHSTSIHHPFKCATSLLAAREPV